jgi:DamX protein
MSDAIDFFPTTDVSARLDLVRHLIENSELVPLVRGPAGIGKTLLASKLQQLAPENWSVCHLEADPAMQPERLLATIARCCGLPDIAGELLQRLVDRFEVLRKRGRVPVLLVDDAEMLPPTSLITLLRLFEKQLNGVRLVSIVLFANQQIDLLLSTPQLQVMSPQAIQVIDLPVMTRQEAAAYMRFLLQNEGLSEKLVLDEFKLNRIYRETQGVPGPLAAAILSAVSEGRVEQSAGSFLSGYKKQLLIGGAPLLAVMLLFMWMISLLIEPELDALPEKRVAKQIKPLPAPTAFSQPNRPRPEVGQSDTPFESQAVDVDRLDQGKLIQSFEGPVNGNSELLIESTETSTVSARIDAVTDVEIATIPTSKGAQESRTNGNRDGIKEKETEYKVQTTVETAADAEQLLDPDQSTALAEAIDQSTDKEVSEVAQGEESDTVAEIAAEDIQQHPLEKTIENAGPNAPLKEEVEDSATEWVMTRAPNRYTLQLIAVENLDSLKRYIAGNGLVGESHTFRMIRNGKPWYALLWGDFPDRTSAQRAVSGLPSKVQESGVWARTFASLQQSQRK